MSQQTDNKYQCTYLLAEVEKQPKEPAAHQHQALTKLQQWFKEQSKYKQSGGILVLPTGGGKTLTAHRFLCTNPLPNGYKVLWLAHTHHLLEQAFYSLESEVKLIHQKNNNKEKLKVRVVSGTKGHFRPCQIKPNDDFLICTLQTVTRAQQNELTQLKAFLKAAGDKLFVIFDEAHHSPAPSYYRFISKLREEHPGMCLLGLTATPLYTDKKKSGRLGELFPQDILYQVSASQLIADGILAKPEFKSAPTKFTPEFDENKYKQWVRDYQDLPEEIITKLAENRDRNSFIAKTYAQNKDLYGKTIIFADRWFQCEQLREFLEQQKKGIKVGTVYSHIDADPGNADARNKRTQDENSKVLEAFRKNELDVLINVRMLTEGTDVPNVNTVFLTRQTTSKILLTQMVGRALRGPRFGGTEKAYIVSFIDDWQQAINWAQYDPLDNRPTLTNEQNQLQTRAMRLISIDLVRRLISQMDSGNNINPVPFSTFMPIGWYKVEFKSSIAGSDDSEPVQLLVMVFENEQKIYQQFIEHLNRANLDEFLDPNVTLENQIQRLEGWQRLFFSANNHIGGDLLKNLFHIARHIAENGEETLDWFDFEQRKEHDLDKIAQDFINKDFGPLTVSSKLQEEYDRRERYWQIIYSDFISFKSHYDACVNRILFPPPAPPPPLPSSPPPPDPEPSEAVKKQVKERDSYRCLCCGEDSRYVLVIDHIIPRYHGGTNSLDNLQTLCRKCNNLKNIQTINFRKYQTTSKEPITTFPQMEKLIKEAGDNPQEWKQLLRRNINFFYQCSSVKSIVKKKGTAKFILEVNLEDGIDRTRVKPHIEKLTQGASSIREWEILIK
ncbi:DEAD/DEAH box helicase family protein [Phormidium sp. LEGE 05292]|uniref:DEAD/DEAH box helicase family protein n=1 Tax=[Phormidium] sp. LEGE 05292 TaxID=767427 RepID=UPI00187DF445|nr:DEAD/DEAH box helicase family protein [Phormidium sp. LEGE 05292]MBE9224698.1 DEAD/DEAH box helicase family protein [Phormidium sp. LEGE 05292]